MTYQRIYIDTTTRHVPPARYPVGIMEAPGKAFDHPRHAGHMAACMGVCGRHKRCPLGGCKVDSAGLNPGRQSPTLH